MSYTYTATPRQQGACKIWHTQIESNTEPLNDANHEPGEIVEVMMEAPAEVELQADFES